MPRARLRLDAFERWVALVVAVVVGIGLLADTYQQYGLAAFHREYAMKGLGNANWGDAFTVVDPTYEYVGTTPVGSVAEIDDALNRAAASGVPVAAIRKWRGDVANPANGVSAPLVPSGLDPAGVVAGYGIDWVGLDVLASGRPPRSGEIALSRSIADKLGVAPGDAVIVSHPDQSAETTLTVSGILRDYASWSFEPEYFPAAESHNYAAIVSWDDSAALSHALLPLLRRILVTQVSWSGGSGELSRHFEVWHTTDSVVGGRWGVIASDIASLAWGVLALAVLAAVALGSRPRRRPLRVSTPARVAGVALIGTLTGATAAAVVSLALHGIFAATVTDLVQPRLSFPPPSLYAWWLIVAVAVSLGLEIAARVRGASLWESRPARAIARFARRLVPSAAWLAVLGIFVLAVTVAWAWIDQSITPTAGSLPAPLLAPAFVAIALVAAWSGARFGRSKLDGGVPGVALAYTATVACLVAFALAPGIAADAARRYNSTIADINAAYDVDPSTQGFLPQQFPRMVDNVEIARTAIVVALTVALVAVLVGALRDTPSRRRRLIDAATVFVTVVVALATGALVGVALDAPLHVHDVSSFLDGRQSASWTVGGLVDILGRVGVIAVCTALTTAITLGAVLAASEMRRQSDRRPASRRLARDVQPPSGGTMSDNEPTIRPNLMHLDKPTRGHGGGGGCGCGGGGCGCGGGGRASRDYVVIEPVEEPSRPQGAA